MWPGTEREREDAAVSVRTDFTTLNFDNAETIWNNWKTLVDLTH